MLHVVSRPVFHGVVASLVLVGMLLAWPARAQASGEPSAQWADQPYIDSEGAIRLDLVATDSDLIKTVVVSVDGGPWQPLPLGPTDPQTGLTHFEAVITPTRAVSEIPTVRAVMVPIQGKPFPLQSVRLRLKPVEPESEADPKADVPDEEVSEKEVAAPSLDDTNRLTVNERAPHTPIVNRNARLAHRAVGHVTQAPSSGGSGGGGGSSPAFSSSSSSSGGGGGGVSVAAPAVVAQAPALVVASPESASPVVEAQPQIESGPLAALAARVEAEQEAARLAAEEAARVEAEQEAARLAAEEAARVEAEQEAARLAAAEAARVAAEQEAARLAAEEAARVEAEQEAARLAAAEATRVAAAQEAARVEAEQEAARLAAEEAARVEAEQEAARLAAEEAARVEAEQEAARLAAAEATRVAAAQEAARVEAEQEAARLAAEEAARVEAEQEAARLAAEEAARVEAEQEAARLAAEESARVEAEQEAARLAAEESARVEAEQEAARLAAEESARVEAEQEAARLAAEESARVAAEQEAARLAAEESARVAAEQEAARLAAEEAARVEAEQEAARLAAEEAARVAAEQEAARLAAEEAARVEAEQEAARLAAEEAARVEAEQEAARLAAEEAARVAAEQEAARLAAEEAARVAAEQEAARLAAAAGASGDLLVPGSGFVGEPAVPAPVGLWHKAGYDEWTIARWDVVPYRAFEDRFEIGVVAFHMNGIDRVEFSVEGGPWVSVNAMSLNPRTKVREYWVALRASDFTDRGVTVRAIAYPTTGKPRVLPDLRLIANAGGTRTDYEPIYVSSTGNDAYPGTKAMPKKSIAAGMRASHHGGEVIILTPGRYDIGSSKVHGSDPENETWMVVRGADYLTQDQVIIARATRGALRPGTNRVCYRNMSFDFSNIDQYYPESTHKIWFDHVRWFDSNGWLASYPQVYQPFHNRGVAYVTNSVAEDMIYGFVGLDFVRQSHLQKISGDALQNTKLVLNCTVDHIDGGVSGHHTDLLQYFGKQENIIVYGLKVTRSSESQSLFLGQVVVEGGGLRNAAFVDLDIDSINDVEQGGPPWSQLQGTMQHVLFDNVKLPGQRFVLRDDMAGFAMRNVSFRRCQLHPITWETYIGSGRIIDGVTWDSNYVTQGSAMVD